MFTKKIKDSRGKEHEVLTPYAKIIVSILLGTGIFGTNLAQYIGVERTEVVQMEDVEKAFDAKLLLIENENLETVIEEVLEHAYRDTRIDQNENRITKVEEDMIEQTTLLYEIRDSVQ